MRRKATTVSARRVICAEVEYISREGTITDRRKWHLKSIAATRKDSRIGGSFRLYRAFDNALSQKTSQSVGNTDRATRNGQRVKGANSTHADKKLNEKDAPKGVFWFVVEKQNYFAG